MFRVDLAACLLHLATFMIELDDQVGLYRPYQEVNLPLSSIVPDIIIIFVTNIHVPLAIKHTHIDNTF